jgi:hypothetical protein
VRLKAARRQRLKPSVTPQADTMAEEAAVGFGRRPFSCLSGPWRSLIRKRERLFGKGVAKDAGNPSGARHFTISTALSNERCEENQHDYNEARS